MCNLSIQTQLFCQMEENMEIFFFMSWSETEGAPRQVKVDS